MLLQKKKKKKRTGKYKLHDLPVIKKIYINHLAKKKKKKNWQGNHLANERDIFNEVNI